MKKPDSKTRETIENNGKHMTGLNRTGLDWNNLALQMRLSLKLDLFA